MVINSNNIITRCKGTDCPSLKSIIKYRKGFIIWMDTNFTSIYYLFMREGVECAIEDPELPFNSTGKTSA